MNKSILFLMSSFLFLIPLSSHAYIGPGMGGGVIAITLGFIGAIFLALFGILYYPIKRAFKKRGDKEKESKKLINKD